MKIKVLFFTVFTFLLISCNQNQKKLSPPEIIEKSIDKHGGLKRWKEVKQIDFDKKTILFKKDGQIEKNIEQHQSFNFKPSLSGKIFSKDGFGVLFDGNTFFKINKNTISIFKNKTSLEKAKNQFYAAEYVVCQPFKLDDKNIILTDKGIQEINKVKAYAIGITYKNDTELSDKWVYYFDVNSFQLIATKVIHLDRDSLIENLSFDTSTDFIFNKERKSFITDKKTKEKYLRARYLYTNFKISYK